MSTVTGQRHRRPGRYTRAPSVSARSAASLSLQHSLGERRPLAYRDLRQVQRHLIIYNFLVNKIFLLLKFDRLHLFPRLSLRSRSAYRAQGYRGPRVPLRGKSERPATVALTTCSPKASPLVEQH